MLRDIIRLSDISEYYRYQRIRYFQKRIIYFKKLECHSVRQQNYRSELGGWDGQKGGRRRNQTIKLFLFFFIIFDLFDFLDFFDFYDFFDFAKLSSSWSVPVKSNLN